MSGSSPSISTTAIAGERNGVGGGGGGLSTDDFYFPADLISVQDRKDEAMLVLKAYLMAALNKEVKSLGMTIAGCLKGHGLVSIKYLDKGVFSRSDWAFQRIRTWPDQDDTLKRLALSLCL